MQHYKKLITVFTVTFLMLSLLVSQAFSITYKIKVLKYYLNSYTSAYWQTYHGSNIDTSDYITTWKVADRTASNNRFTCNFDTPGDESHKDYDNLFRCDLVIRVNDFGIQYKKDDVLIFDIYMSTKFEMYDRITTYPNLEPSRYYLQFFRVWFEDDTTLVFFPEHYINTSFEINDNWFYFKSEPLPSDRPRIVSLQFSFNLVEPAFNQLNPPNGYYPLHMNVWFNDYFDLIVDRDTANAPIYTPEDDTIIKDQQQLEDQIYNDIDDGLNGASDMWGSFGTLVSNDGRLYRGLMFVTNLLNKFLGIEMFSILGTFGLSLGIFAFLIGIAQLIKSSVERKEREQNRNNRR